MKFHHFFFAVHTETGVIECFATKYLQMTDKSPARIKFWMIGGDLKQISKPKIVSWDYKCRDQEEQLQDAIGKSWKVLPFWVTCDILQKHFTPTKNTTK